MGRSMRNVSLVIAAFSVGATASPMGCGSSNELSGAGGTGAGGAAMGSGGAAGSDAATACREEGTLMVTASGATAYLIDGVSNPTLTFCRGRTYTFAVNAPGHPFYVKTAQTTGTVDAYTSGVTGNGATGGQVVFSVPADAPATLFYVCTVHAPMTGPIKIVD